MSGGRGDFWSNLLKERAASTSASSSTSVADIASDIPQTINQQVIFIGDAGAGKSSLIQTFLKPNAVKDTKPTVALEFNFARKTSNNTKYVANLWEVGGDFLEGSYLEIPLTKDTLGSQSCAIVLVVDLSKPQNAVVSVLRSIASIREVLKRKLAELQAIAVHQVNDLKEKTAQSYKGHPDSNKVKPLEIPLVIIANKQDLMKTMSVAERRAIIQSLRFIAHYFGAILMTVSANDVYMKESFRGLLNSLCFNAALKPCHETNLEKMIFITRGQDSFENILLGHLASPENNVESAKVSDYPYFFILLTSLCIVSFDFDQCGNGSIYYTERSDQSLLESVESMPFSKFSL